MLAPRCMGVTLPSPSKQGLSPGRIMAPLPRHRGWKLCSLLSLSSALQGRKLLRNYPGPVQCSGSPSTATLHPSSHRDRPSCRHSCSPSSSTSLLLCPLPHYPPPLHSPAGGFQHLLVIYNIDSSTAPSHPGHLSHDPPLPPPHINTNPKRAQS